MSRLRRQGGGEAAPWLILALVLLLTALLPYQLAVVARCARLVKKGGQHYVVPVTTSSGSGGSDAVSETVTLDSQT